jgi:DNA-binding HxlR family transcriptional regulator
MTPRQNAPRGAYRRPPRANAVPDCPLTAALAALGGKWKLILVYRLSRGDQHFGALERRLAPISHKVLTDQLRELEADRIVERRESGPVPAPVTYRLTDYGKQLLPIVESVRLWGAGHIGRLRAATSSSSASSSAASSPS